MDGLYKFALSIVDYSQPEWNGGLIPVILSNIHLDNASKSDNFTAKDHFLVTITSGGYLAALSAGIIWFTLLFLCALFFFVMHCRRKHTTKVNISMQVVYMKFAKMREQCGNHWAYNAVQFILLILVILFLLIFVIFTIIAIGQLNSAITSSSDSGRDNGIFPRIDQALDYMHEYFQNFAQRSKQDTKFTIDKIIYATEVMQNETMDEFNKILFARMGVTQTFDLGEQMVVILSRIFDYFHVLELKLVNFKTALSRINEINERFKFFHKYNLQCPENNQTCDKELNEFIELSLINKTILKTLEDSKTFKPITLFKGVMEANGKNESKIREEMEYGKQQLKIQLDKTYLRMKRELNIPESIRNMTDEIWEESSHQLEEQAAMIKNISQLIKMHVYPIAKSGGGGLTVLFIAAIFVVLLGTVISTFIVLHYFCIKGDLSDVMRNRFKLIIYSLLLLLAFIVVLSSTMGFLTGGYTRTEVCRYLNSNHKSHITIGPNKTLVIDHYINQFLDDNWQTIENNMPKMDIPVPKPKDVLSGILNECAEDKGLFQALHGVDKIDPAALNRPELAKKFITIGRQIMIDQIRDTDPRDMMPEGMEDNLVLAKNVDNLFKSEPLTKLTKQLQQPLFVEKKTDLINKVKHFTQKYNLNLKLSDLMEVFDGLKEYKDLYESSKTIIIDNIQRVKSEKKVKPVVEAMKSELDNMTSLMLDKTRCLPIANKLFDQHIAETTPQKAMETMKKFGPEILSNVGRCRNLFKAYKEVETAICYDTLYPMNGIWLTLGSSLFFLSPLSIWVMSLLTKKLKRDNSNYKEVPMLPMDVPGSNGDGITKVPV